jgi:segregation and condensation protein A
MIKEENILKVIIEKESWEEIIYYIVSIEKLDPWDVDLVKLTDGFIKFLSQVEELDFRIPAKVVFVACILLRLKAESLILFEDSERFDESEKTKEEIKMLEIRELGVPLIRIPKRQVTLEELIVALRKALTVVERREERKRRARVRVEAEITGENIKERIEKVMNKINELVVNLNREKIAFRELVPKWERKEIVYNLIPILHLDQDRKIETEQEEIFKEIWIKKV